MPLAEKPIEARYDSYIEAGNKLREKLGRADAFALLAISGIRKARLQLTKKRDSPAHKQAYIVSQFKRPEEIEALRRVYGQHFILLSVHSSRSSRVDYLTNLIARSHHLEGRSQGFRSVAETLVNRDEEEEEKIFGQRLRETFYLGDFVARYSDHSHIGNTINRIIGSFFGNPFITPTRDEYFSYVARSAALRSSDLSRQVGAAIVSPSGEIISLGCNEVPKAGGGSYWEDDQHDYKDYCLGHDPNVRFRDQIIADLFQRLKPKWLSDDKKNMDIEDLINLSLFDSNEAVLRGARITEVLEFGRVVHAEMLAISDAARRGLSTKDATLYCTTFPCHNCARHIISSGISKVIYIEPYPKSLAADLYKDSIVVDGHRYHPSASVEFTSFEGISPNKYREIFTKGKRKNKDGSAISWNPVDSKPIIRSFFPAYVELEFVVLEAFAEKMENSGLVGK